MEFKTFSLEDLKIKMPFGMHISGPSTSGKTTFMARLIDQSNNMFEPRPSKIIYAYGQFSAIIPKLQARGILVNEGVPDDELINKLPKNSIIILDDL